MFNNKGKIWFNVNFEYVRRRIQLISEVLEFVLEQEKAEFDRNDSNHSKNSKIATSYRPDRENISMLPTALESSNYQNQL